MPMYVFKADPILLTFSPLTSDRRIIGEYEDECPLSQVPVAHVKAIYKVARKQPLPHRLSIGAKQYLALHRSAFELMESNTVLPSDLVRVPLVVNNSKHVAISSDYFLLHANYEHDVLDRRHSVVDCLVKDDGTEVIISVIEWAAKRSKLPLLDLFPVSPVSVR